MLSTQRRLDEVAAQLDDGGNYGDYGPHHVIVITRHWRPDSPEAHLGAAGEQAKIDQAIEEVRREARARREHVQCVVATVGRDGKARVEGVPWLSGPHDPLSILGTVDE